MNNAGTPEAQAPATACTRPLTAAAAPRSPSSLRRLDSRQLFDGGHEIEIAHDGAIYRLRRTALGKLILTK